MKKRIASATLLLLVVSFLFYGCKKWDDLFPGNNNTGSLEVKSCVITSLRQTWGGEPDVANGTFNYNALGQPVSILFDQPGGTGRPGMYFFRYDAQHRLSDFIEAFDSTSYDSWHVYVYNAKGQIVQDSVYTWGEINGHHPSETAYFGPSYTNYAYDDQNRMIKATNYIEEEVSASGSYVYVYNSAGNVAAYRGDGYEPRANAVYDNKINVNRTNKIWMFLSRDYSRNNLVPAVSYNEKGLPLAFPSGYYLPFFTTLSDPGPARFDYSCSGSN